MNLIRRKCTHLVRSAVGKKNAISGILPESRFKNFLRRLLFTYYNPLDVLSKIIAKVEQMEDGALLVTLTEGIKFYARRDEELDRNSYFLIKYRNRRIFPQIEGLEYFGVLWRELLDQYMDDVYQKYYKVKRNDIVVDLGAHIGTFTIKAAKAVGDKGIVIALEPDIDNVRLLERNIRVNDLKNVIIMQMGVWSSKDRLKYFVKGVTSRHSFLNPRYSYESREVLVDTLDNILNGLSKKKVDFVKMDIEGAEIEALKGMQETLKNNNTKLAVAAYHIVEGEQTHKTIVPWLKENGFNVASKNGIVYASKNS